MTNDIDYFIKSSGILDVPVINFDNKEINKEFCCNASVGKYDVKEIKKFFRKFKFIIKTEDHEDSPEHCWISLYYNETDFKKMKIYLILTNESLSDS